MSIRLNKALRELNIGLQTAVEFLSKRSDLGEVEAEPSFKLSDQQYKALTDAFSQDKKVRDQAEKLFTKKTKDKKRVPEQKEDREENAEVSNGKQQFKPLGKIDLDSIGKPAAKSAAPENRKASGKESAAVSSAPVTNASKAEAKASHEHQKVMLADRCLTSISRMVREIMANRSKIIISQCKIRLTTISHNKARSQLKQMLLEACSPSRVRRSSLPMNLRCWVRSICLP